MLDGGTNDNCMVGAADHPTRFFYSWMLWRLKFYIHSPLLLEAERSTKIGVLHCYMYKPK